jgi:hypothetical protein
MVIEIFCNVINIDNSLFNKLKSLTKKYKILDKKNDFPLLEHLSKDKEAWKVLVNSLYNFYVKKSNLKLGRMNKINIIQFMPYFPPHK